MENKIENMRDYLQHLVISVLSDRNIEIYVNYLIETYLKMMKTNELLAESIFIHGFSNYLKIINGRDKITNKKIQTQIVERGIKILNDINSDEFLRKLENNMALKVMFVWIKYKMSEYEMNKRYFEKYIATFINNDNLHNNTLEDLSYMCYELLCVFRYNISISNYKLFSEVIDKMEKIVIHKMEKKVKTHKMDKLYKLNKHRDLFFEQCKNCVIKSKDKTEYIDNPNYYYLIIKDNVEKACLIIEL